MFKLINRKHKNYLVLIPGWAFDHRIFDSLDLPCNYIFFCGSSIVDFEEKLKNFLAENNIDRISLLGWSQGAFAACDFAAKNPAAVDELILTAAKKKYEKQPLTNIKNYLTKNKKIFLYKFYQRCFSEHEKDSYLWFKKSLSTDYIKQLSSQTLIEALDHLADIAIDIDSLKKINSIKIVHGKNDAIAPFDQAAKFADALKNANLITFENTGHLPFLRKDFKDRLYE